MVSVQCQIWTVSCTCTKVNVVWHTGQLQHYIVENTFARIIFQENTGIKYLNLSMNGFQEEGARALETMLRENHTLLELDISFCRIPLGGSPSIAAGIQNNDTLEKINVSFHIVYNKYFCFKTENILMTLYKIHWFPLFSIKNVSVIFVI